MCFNSGEWGQVSLQNQFFFPLGRSLLSCLELLHRALLVSDGYRSESQILRQLLLTRENCRATLA